MSQGFKSLGDGHLAPMEKQARLALLQASPDAVYPWEQEGVQGLGADYLAEVGQNHANWVLAGREVDRVLEEIGIPVKIFHLLPEQEEKK